MTTSTRELIDYYVNLLIIQYQGKAKARATIEAQNTPMLMPQVSTQVVSFGTVAPASGTFVLSYDDVASAAINWNDSEATIQTKLRAITGLSTITVSGSPATLSFTVTFAGVDPIALLLVLESSTLNTGEPTITETDETLPLAIQNAFSLDTAVGVQLDTLGKYAGVVRIGQGFTAPIELDDDDFRSLIRMAVLTNSAGSDLYTIQSVIQTFFGDQMFVYDYQTMRLSYLVDSSIGSRDLLEMAIVQGLLPKPMAVQLSTTIYNDVIDTFFGYGTYEIPAYNNSPYNTYQDYQEDQPFLDYGYGVF